MKRILITGKNSYVGTSVKKYLEQWPKKYMVDELDVKGDTWRSFDFSKYDVIFHVAGIAHVDVKKADEKTKKLYYKVNCDLADEVAKAAKKADVKQFIFMSSAIVYGDSAPIGKKKVVTKDTEPAPANFYGDSKLQAEIKLNKLANSSFKVAIIRPPMIYGQGCKGNYQTLRKIALKVRLFPRIENERSMLYIGNLAEFVRLIIKNEDCGIFYPQNPDYSNTSEMVKKIAEANGKKVRLVGGFGWLCKFMSHFTALTNKAFGNLSYSQQLSKYRESYQKYDLNESILEIER